MRCAMNELSYRLNATAFVISNGWIVFFLFATPTFSAISYILIESRSVVPSSAHGSIIPIFRYTHRDNYRTLICGSNTTGGDIDIPRPCAHLGTDIPFLHRRPLARRYKFAFNCIATCTRTRIDTFGVKSVCARVPVCICLICTELRVSCPSDATVIFAAVSADAHQERSCLIYWLKRQIGMPIYLGTRNRLQVFAHIIRSNRH